MKHISPSQNQTTIIDDADFEEVSKHQWSLQEVNGHSYAVTTVMEGKEKRRLYLHRYLLGVEDSKQVKHLDGDTLNNQRANLETTPSFLGVSYLPKGRKHWRATLRFDGQQKHLGMFETAEEAAQARDEAAVELWGVHATLNYPLDLPQGTPTA